MTDLTAEEARRMVLGVEGNLGRLEAAVNVAGVLFALARLKRAVDNLTEA